MNVFGRRLNYLLLLGHRPFCGGAFVVQSSNEFVWDESALVIAEGGEDEELT